MDSLVTSCIDAWKNSSLSCSLVPPMFLRNGFNVRLTSAHIIIGTDSVKSSLRRYWSSVSLTPPLLQANSPKTFKNEKNIEMCVKKIWWKFLNWAVTAFRKGTELVIFYGRLLSNVKFHDDNNNNNNLFTP